MIQIIFLSILFLFLTCFINNEEVLAFTSTNISITPRILGGTDADILDFPFIASLRYKSSYFCMASCVGIDDILAPAHCFTHMEEVIWPYIDITIHTGTASPEEEGRMYEIRSLTVHPGWTGTGDGIHDIAHAKLTGRIANDEYEQKVNMPRQNVKSNLLGWVVGWGETEPNVEVIAEKLQKTKMWTLKYTDCHLFLPPDTKLEEGLLCVYQMEGYGCSESDRGAPLVIGNKIIGIHSWTTSEQCAVGEPEVYVNIFAEKDFLLPLIQAN